MRRFRLALFGPLLDPLCLCVLPSAYVCAAPRGKNEKVESAQQVGCGSHRNFPHAHDRSHLIGPSAMPFMVVPQNVHFGETSLRELGPDEV